MESNISRSIPRIDAEEKVTGQALYLNDIPVKNLLYGRFYRSTVAKGEIKSIYTPPLPEGYYKVDYRDIPGENSIALIKSDWPVFAEKEVRFKGEILFLLVGPNRQTLDSLIRDVKVEYREETPVYTIEEALSKGGDNLFVEYNLKKGEVDKHFETADRIIEGSYRTGFQEHLYLEPQSLDGYIKEDGTLVIRGSMQCPYYVKHSVQQVVGKRVNVQIIQTLTGGGFGGKEDYPEVIGCSLAAAVLKIKKPIRVVFDRSEDLAFTTKRHPSLTKIRTAHNREGKIIGIDIDLLLNGGAYESYSAIVLQRAIFTSNGAYTFPAARVRGRAVVTNTVPSGAFRGFGAPQAIFAIESHMNYAASQLSKPILHYKKSHFAKQGDTTVTCGRVREPVKLNEISQKIDELSSFSQKREVYKNVPMRGIGVSFLNHGCGFTGDGEQKIIKAKVQLAKDSSDRVKILVSNVDMGQGLFTTLRKIVSQVLEIPPESIEYPNPDTEKVPDSGPTVASRSVMIVGKLLQDAAEILKKEWIPQKEQLIETHYKMPKGLKWDQQKLKGDAYPVFGWGAHVVEVEVDPDTYEAAIIGSWAVFDVGVAIDEKVVKGQIEGGTAQALSFGSFEKLELKEGLFYQRSLADYTIPTAVDLPRTEVLLVENPYGDGPFGAKGVGEIVHGGGHPAFTHALEQALGVTVSEVPMTPEKIMEALKDAN